MAEAARTVSNWLLVDQRFKTESELYWQLNGKQSLLSGCVTVDLLTQTQTPTWPETEDVSPVRVRPWQDCEKAFVQDVLHCGRLQVLENLWPGFATGVVVEEQLQSTVIVKLPGPQEAQQEGVVQPRPEIGLFLQRKGVQMSDMFQIQHEDALEGGTGKDFSLLII